METYFVLKNGAIIQNTATRIPYEHGHKEIWHACRDDKLYIITDFYKDYGIGTHSGRESEKCIGRIAYTFTDKDVEDAKFLLRMERYFPDLKPSKVSEAVKKLMERLKNGLTMFGTI